MVGAINDAMARSSESTDDRRVSEASIDNVLSYSAVMRGADDLAYPPVVAGGSNTANNQVVRSCGEYIKVIGETLRFGYFLVTNHEERENLRHRKRDDC